MTWPPHVPFPVPMNLRDPIAPDIPVEVAFTMRSTPRDEMTTGEAAAWRDGYARGFAESADEANRMRREIEALRLTLGGRTYSADTPAPIGCPCPGACVQVAEIGRLRSIVRVNGLRAGASHAEIDALLYATPPENARARASQAGFGAAGMEGSSEAPKAASGPHSHCCVEGT